MIFFKNFTIECKNCGSTKITVKEKNFYSGYEKIPVYVFICCECKTTEEIL